MLKVIKYCRKRQFAFSVVEIVVVILIASILVFTAFKGFGMVRNFTVRSLVKQIKELETATNLFYESNSGLPGDAALSEIAEGTSSSAKRIDVSTNMPLNRGDGDGLIEFGYGSSTKVDGTAEDCLTSPKDYANEATLAMYHLYYSNYLSDKGIVTTDKTQYSINANLKDNTSQSLAATSVNNLYLSFFGVNSATGLDAYFPPKLSSVGFKGNMLVLGSVLAVGNGYYGNLTANANPQTCGASFASKTTEEQATPCDASSSFYKGPNFLLTNYTKDTLSCNIQGQTYETRSNLCCSQINDSYQITLNNQCSTGYNLTTNASLITGITNQSTTACSYTNVTTSVTNQCCRQLGGSFTYGGSGGSCPTTWYGYPCQLASAGEQILKGCIGGDTFETATATTCKCGPYASSCGSGRTADLFFTTTTSGGTSSTCNYTYNQCTAPTNGTLNCNQTKYSCTPASMKTVADPLSTSNYYPLGPVLKAAEADMLDKLMDDNSSSTGSLRSITCNYPTANAATQANLSITCSANPTGSQDAKRTVFYMLKI